MPVIPAIPDGEFIMVQGHPRENVIKIPSQSIVAW
jgi:hypothetical protein